jgi:hypothetical protein
MTDEHEVVWPKRFLDAFNKLPPGWRALIYGLLQRKKETRR